MSTAWQQFDGRILDWLTREPSRIPLITGGCHSGRSAMLDRVRARLGPEACQLADISRITTTPERFCGSLAENTPFSPGVTSVAADGPAQAFARALSFLTAAGAQGAPATFLLDEILDLRTFESFPGLKSVVRDTFEGLVSSRNRFVLTTRFACRALRVVRDQPGRLLVQAVPALEPDDVTPDLERIPGMGAAQAEEVARSAVALTDGRYGYLRDLADYMGHSATLEPVPALIELLSPGGLLARRCAFSYELRLNRTRGYGALRAILAILADEEPLTLTEIALQLRRTPGSTKDYLSWLEEVDLVAVGHKRYAFTDPVLRLWVRLNAGAVRPTKDQVAGEVRRYALGRLP
ncbi:MAG: hypothetical protein AB1806_03665 [Acidobacteriota bacterium]